MNFKLRKTAIVLLMLTSIFPALARDWRVYPGAMGYQSYSNSTKITRYGGILQNNETNKWVYLELPFVQDVDEKKVKTSGITVKDRSPSNSISARLWASWGSALWATPSQSTNGAGPNYEYLEFPELAPSISGEAQRQYYFTIALPPKWNNLASQIHSYYLLED